MSLWSAEAWAATKVDNGDGTYCLDTALGYTGPTSITRGVLSLEYVGPARYSWVPSLLIGETVADDGTIDLPTDPVEGLIGGSVVDGSGIEWEITEVNRDLLADKVSDYFDSFDEVEGPLDELVSAGTFSTALCYDYAAGLEEEPGYIEFEGYQKHTYLDAKSYTWVDGDHELLTDMGDFTDGMTSAIVWLELPNSEEGVDEHCSGTLIADDWVLTAGHCVYDHKTNISLDHSEVSVGQCHGAGTYADVSGVEYIIVNPRFYEKNRPRHDWALVRLTTALGADGHHMALSRASDTRIENIDSIDDYQMAGYPGIDSDGDPNETGYVQWNRNGSHDKTLNRSLRIDITHGGGNSGGAHFYDGSTPGGTWYVYAVHSGHRPGTNWSARGPKVPHHHVAIITEMEEL